MKLCKTCRHYRPFRPTSQLLALELGVEHQDLVSELLKIMQDERSKRDEEASLKVRLLGDQVKEWPFLPAMSDFCGLKESEGVALLHQIKNRRANCAEHEPIDGERACLTCTHCRVGDGKQRDRTRLAKLIKLAENAAALGQASDGPKVDDFRKLIGTKMAFEGAQAYYAGKVALRQPEYLTFCGHFSTPTDYFPCVVQNPHSRCGAWTGQRQEEPVASAAAAAEPAVVEPPAVAPPVPPAAEPPPAPPLPASQEVAESFSFSLPLPDWER